MSPRRYRLGRRAAGVAANRESIIEAARALFTETGFHGVSVDDVARRADVARKTVYYHFGSKMGLVDALLADAERRAGFDRLLGMEALLDPAEAAHGLLREACRFWAADHDVFRSIFGLASVDPEARNAVQVHEMARRDALGRLVRRLEELGGLGDGWPSERAVAVLWWLTSFATFDQLHGQGGLPVDAVADTLVDAWEAVAGGHQAPALELRG